MKKLITITMMLILLFLGIITSYATEGKNIEMKFTTPKTTITKDTKTVEFIFSLGNFTGIQENIVLGYEATLTYDESIFEKATVEGLNNWAVGYEETNGALIGDIASAKANTDITKITLTLKDGIQVGTSGKVTLKVNPLTDEMNDFTFSKEITMTIEQDKPAENTTGNTSTSTNTTGNKENNTGTATNTGRKPQTTKNNTTIVGNTKDPTTSSTKIPAAGLGQICIIAIVLLAVGIICYIRYKIIKIRPN